MKKKEQERGFAGQKLMRAAVLAAMVTAGAAISASAATKESIEEISLSIDSEIEEGQTTDSIDSVTIEIETDGCYLDEDNTKITNQPSDGWDDDDKPKLKIVVLAESGYSFKSGLGKDDIYLDDSSATVTSVNRSSSKVTISVTLPEVSESSIYNDDDFSLALDEDELSWDSSGSGYAYWDGTDYARYYELRLYRDGSLVNSTARTTEDNSYNFASMMTSAGSYTFKVRAVWNSSEKGDWVESDSLTVSSSTASANGSGTSTSVTSGSGRWVQYEQGTWWCYANGGWPANQWLQIDGVWYWFNTAGYRVENQWALVNGKYYYLGTNGVMAANTRTPDGYWVGSDGAWDNGAAVRQ